MLRSISLVLFLFFLAAGTVSSTDVQIPLAPSDPHASSSWSWSDCGALDDIVELKSLTLSPDPPQPGKNLTVHATGHVGKTINKGAYADVTVKLGLIKLLTKTFDICTEAANANVSLQCPVEPGDQDVKHTVSLPSQIPPAKFNVEVKAYNDDDEALMCATIVIDFLPGKRLRF